MAPDNGEQGIWIESGETRRPRRAGGGCKGLGIALWRLFFMQSSRSERLMDGLGFLSVVAPFLVRQRGSAGDPKEPRLRHLGYFNGGVYLASAVAGVVVNLERRRASGEDIAAERIERVKSALSSVLAARANHFFDMVLIPLGLTIAALFAIYNSYIGPLIFLALYNFYHFQTRIGGFCRGVELGEGVGGAFVTRLFGEARFLEGCAAFASGVFAALLFVKAGEAGGISFMAAGAAAMGGAAALGRRCSVTVTVCITAVALTMFLVATAFFVLK